MLKNLLSSNARIYVYTPDRELSARFLENAEREGFSFSNGKKPTEGNLSDIFVLHSDMTVSYANFIGHMVFFNPKAAGFKMLRLDYGKYLSGEENFII